MSHKPVGQTRIRRSEAARPPPSSRTMPKAECADAPRKNQRDADRKALAQAPRCDRLEGGLQSTCAEPRSSEATLDAANKELAATRAQLHLTTVKLETANEELRVSNEELIATNEELHAINEELRTSTQYIHCINRELEQKIKELATANDDLQNLFVSTNVAAIFLDRELRIVKFTPAAAELFHILRTDVGRPISDLALPLQCQSLLADAHLTLADETPAERLMEMHDTGTWLTMRASPYREADGAGSTAGVVVTFSDVTALKHAEGALQATNVALRETDRTKNEFLAVLSHELRNPLAPIRYSLHVLDRSPPECEQARRARFVMGRQIGQLARLVDDLLDVTRINQGKIEIQRAPVDLGPLLQRIAEDHRSEFADSGTEFQVCVSHEPVWVNVDAARIAQTVGNLLQNAVKFTGRGERVMLSLEEDREARLAVVRVRDTGIGIHPRMLARIFEPFTQVDDTLDRKSSKRGLGLGLTLVKRLIELHGGSVQAQSDGPGKGAELTLRLPLCTEQDPCESASFRTRTDAHRRVLIIEDDVDSADTLRDVLELNDNEVAIAHDGGEGIEMARRFKPDVVLCDIGLPGMNGYAVARAFRGDEALRTTFLVALSGYALPEDEKRATEAGFDRHLAKPPSPEKLDEVMCVAVARSLCTPSVTERCFTEADRVE